MASTTTLKYGPKISLSHVKGGGRGSGPLHSKRLWKRVFFWRPPQYASDSAYVHCHNNLAPQCSDTYFLHSCFCQNIHILLQGQATGCYVDQNKITYGEDVSVNSYFIPNLMFTWKYPWQISAKHKVTVWNITLFQSMINSISPLSGDF